MRREYQILNRAFGWTAARAKRDSVFQSHRGDGNRRRAGMRGKIDARGLYARDARSVPGIIRI